MESVSEHFLMAQKGRRRLCSARWDWRKAHSRTPNPSASPTI